MMPRVKICGLTRVEDARLAQSLGADLLGCVLAADSPRRASLRQVAAIRARAAVPVVLVFRAPRFEAVIGACRATGVERVQLHGDIEFDPGALEHVGIRAYRAIAVERADLRRVRASAERPVVLDVGGGGTGRTFDWNRLGSLAPAHAFIAGGITPGNVGALLRHAPYGIDLASGVERRPGVVDPAQLRALFGRLRGVR